MTEPSGGKIIQIEEPKLYLSPTAVRWMRDLVYNLGAQPGIQVMACTHSPIMIDFSRPKQTVALVERTANGSAVRQSSGDIWSKDERDQLRLVYILNPMASEALFANKIVLAEGPTEVAALNKMLAISEAPIGDMDIHIVNCGGKTELPVFQSIMRAFSRRYLAVHDLDVRETGEVAEWARNEAIWKEIEKAKAEGVDALGFVWVEDFESAHGYTKRGKYAALDASRFVEEALADDARRNDESIPIIRLRNALLNWQSPFQTIADVRAL